MRIQITITHDETGAGVRRLSRTKLSASLGLLLALLLGGASGVAIATIPDAGTKVFHGCVSTKSGSLRLVDPSKGQSCSASENAVTWDQTGVAGANGTSILNGSGPPRSIVTVGGPPRSVGSVGDFYLDTTNEVLYGPKVLRCASGGLCFGAWPAKGTSLIGPGAVSHVWSCPYTPSPSVCVLGSPQVAVRHFVDAPVRQMKLPPGSYSILATVHVGNQDNDSQAMTCDLDANYSAAAPQWTIDRAFDPNFPGLSAHSPTNPGGGTPRSRSGRFRATSISRRRATPPLCATRTTGSLRPALVSAPGRRCELTAANAQLNETSRTTD